MPDMERNFMSRLDSEAADILKRLEDGLPLDRLSVGQRNAWSRFIWAQSIRTPSEIDQLKSAVKEAWEAGSQDLRENYLRNRSAKDPETYDDYLKLCDPYTEDRLALSIAQSSIEHSAIIEIISNMYWRILDLSKSDFPLLTSDRPVWMTTTLLEADAGLLVPLGPNRLFAATRDIETMRNIISRRPTEYVKCVNKITVEHAVKFVFGVNDHMLNFVQKHFAKKRHTTVMERLAATRGYRVIAKNSPANLTNK